MNKSRISRLPVCLVVLMALRIAHGGELRDIFPKAAMQDPRTLDLKITSRTVVPSTLDPSQELTRIELEFTSFEWEGETWRHPAIALLPTMRVKRYLNAGVIVASPRANSPSDVRYAESAALMGLPVLMIAGNNPGPHYGYRSEGDLMGYGSKRFRETGDPHWIGYAWLGKVIVRAVTAAREVPGFDADRFVITGCSKRGVAAWIAAGADDRIIGAFPTCWNAGNFEAWLELKAARWGLDYQPKAGQKTLAPGFITTREQINNAHHPRGREERNFTDPYRFQQRLAKKPVLFATGTNDPLFPAASDAVFLPHMPGGIRVLLVPNSGHTSNTEQHFKAWRMWIAHCLAGRDVPTIDVTAQRHGRELTVTAEVRANTEIKSVRCWSAADTSGALLDATWQATELTRAGDGRYRGTLPATDGTHIGYFIEVEDDDPETVPGVITSGFREAVD